MRFIVVSMLCFVAVVANAAPQADGITSTEAADLARLAAKRYDAVVSGHLVSTYHNISTKRRDYPEEDLYFDADSWAIRNMGESGLNALIDHNGYHLSYQGDRVRRFAQFFDSKPLASNTSGNRPPVFAGSFWLAKQAEWTDANAHKFKLVREATVNGVPTKVIETEPGAAPPFAFPHRLLKGGILRLYVAPSLNGALPKIENIGNTGVLITVHEALHFSESDPGIFTPSKITSETVLPANDTFDEKTNVKSWFDVDFSIVNRPIPEEMFKVKLPAGTIVQDSRTGKGKRFKIEQEKNSNEVAEKSEGNR